MKDFAPRDPDFERRVRESFARQRAMETFGAGLLRVAPGAVEIGFEFREEFTQQHGYLHAGVVTALVDTACGYAALSLTEPGTEVLSVEFKLNLLSPAAGRNFVARARVVRAGRNLTVCAGDLYALKDDGEKIVATMLATMMSMRG
ncbi:MAG: PaaI family thioesterase [Acidobacteria bacterium]|nr:PaaI family thioesterase [Acidobacteriota bacterium]